MKTLIDNLNKKNRRGAPRGNSNAARCKPEGSDGGVSTSWSVEPDDGGGGGSVEPPPDEPDDDGELQLPEAACDNAEGQAADETIQNNSDELNSIQNNSDELNSIQNNSDELKNKSKQKNNSLYINNYLLKDSNLEFKDSAKNLKQEFKESQGPPVNLNFKRGNLEIEPDMILVWRDKFRQAGQDPPDFAMAWQKIQATWNDRNVKYPLPPFRRDFFSLKRDEMQIFFAALINNIADEIINAIKNYQFVMGNDDYYELVFRFRSIFTFLEKGVGTFYLDENIDSQFLRKKRKEAVNG